MAQNGQSLIPAEVIAGKTKFVKQIVKKLQPTLENTLPKHITPERIMRVVVNAFSTTPKLVECEPFTLVRAILQSSMLGLEPNTPLQEAALIPFKQTDRNHPNYDKLEVQFQPMYMGLMKLARQSAEIASWVVAGVYEGDEFVYEEQLRETVFKHKRQFEGERGKLRLVYSKVYFKDPNIPPSIEIMTRADIDIVKKSSKTSGWDRNKKVFTPPEWSPWVQHEEAMWKKSVIKRHCKMLPRSIELPGAVDTLAKAIELDNLAKAIELDNQAEIGEPQTYDEIVATITEETGPDGKKTTVATASGKRTEEVAGELAAKAAEAKKVSTSTPSPAAVEQGVSEETEPSPSDDSPIANTGAESADGGPLNENETVDEETGELFASKVEMAAEEHELFFKSALAAKNFNGHLDIKKKTENCLTLYAQKKLSLDAALSLVDELSKLPIKQSKTK